MNALVRVFSFDEFNTVCNCYMAEKIQIFYKLQEYTNQVKESKINLHIHNMN